MLMQTLGGQTKSIMAFSEVACSVVSNRVHEKKMKKGKRVISLSKLEFAQFEI